MIETEINEMELSIQYLRQRAKELRKANMRIAASLYENKADEIQDKVRRFKIIFNK